MWSCFVSCMAIVDGLSFNDFVAVLCVMVEARCRKEGLDVKEVATEMCATVHEVNDALGEIEVKEG